MIKKLMFAVATMIATMGFAFAQVDVNKADAAALDSIKGVGPKMSKIILDERAKGGDFKDWADFEKRVKGIGPKNSKKLSMAGLQVSGKSMDGAEMTAGETKGSAKLVKATPPEVAGTAKAKPAAAKPAPAPKAM
ncbi:MAG: uptake protein [Massilia sp.]|jgi:competence protein ComEA|nr:uptake protein [Massilia sp.]MDB5906552.1 uptake protein [Massilia sp.]